MRPPGHHAEHNEAMGFCLFNNVAIAANYLLNERPDLGIKKILIVDWDVHHGNGTQKMFYSDPRVLFFSVHRFDYGSFYPAEGDASHCFIGEGAGTGYNINVPWEHGKCGDADYIAAWDHVLLPVTEAFDPDIISVSAGFDAGFAQGRIVMALEGGYNLRSIANSVCSCVKVLLGDKFTCNSPEMQPFESTRRVIQAVRDELKTCWPVLSSKLPENVSLRSKPSQVNGASGAATVKRSGDCTVFSNESAAVLWPGRRGEQPVVSDARRLRTVPGPTDVADGAIRLLNPLTRALIDLPAFTMALREPYLEGGPERVPFINPPCRHHR